MQLELGKRADYAVRVVLDLARHEGVGLRKAREIATGTAVPRAYLSRILAMLVDAEVVRSHAGPAGGYELVRPPNAVDLLSVIEAAEGPLRSTECVLRDGPCRWEGTCTIHEPWTEAQEALRARLARTYLSELVAADAAL